MKVPSVLIANTDKGKKILEKIYNNLPCEYKNITLMEEKYELEILIEKVRDIRGKNSGIDQYIFCNFIFILCDYIDLKDFPSDFIAKYIFIIDDNFNSSKYLEKVTYFKFSKTTNKNENLSEEALLGKILSFLIILICSDIYMEREYNKWFLPEGQIMSMSIESNWQDQMMIKEYLKNRIIKDLLETSLNKDDNIDYINEAIEENTKWFDDKCKLIDTLDINKLLVSPKTINPILSFFSFKKWRVEKIKNYYNDALNSIKDYLVNKKQKAKQYKEEVENRILDKFKSNLIYEFFSNLIKKMERNNRHTLTSTKDIINEFVNENSGKIIELAKKRKEQMKWESLRNPLDFIFSESSLHPNWPVMLILFFIAIFSFIPKIILKDFIPFKIFIQLPILFAMPLLIYIIISKIFLVLKEKEMLRKWSQKIRLINHFFEKSFYSLLAFYEHSYLLQLRRELEIEYKNFCDWIDNSLKNKKEKVTKDLNVLKEKMDEKVYSELGRKISTDNFIKVSELLNSYNNRTVDNYFDKTVDNFTNNNLNDALNLINTILYEEKNFSQLVKGLQENSLSILCKDNFQSIAKMVFYYSGSPYSELSYIKDKEIKIIKINYPTFAGIIHLVKIIRNGHTDERI